MSTVAVRPCVKRYGTTSTSPDGVPEAVNAVDIGYNLNPENIIFKTRGSMSEAMVCFVARKECAFLLGMIKNIRQMVRNYIGTLTAPISFTQPLPAQEKITITEKGLIALIYYKAFNERLPENPDDLQKQKIQAVIDAIKRAAGQA